jgi:hypothetical protein
VDQNVPSTIRIIAGLVRFPTGFVLAEQCPFDRHLYHQIQHRTLKLGTPEGTKSLHKLQDIRPRWRSGPRPSNSET